MMNKLAGNVWWELPRNGAYTWNIEAGDTVYSATQANNAWTVVNAAISNRPYSLNERLGKIIMDCLTDEFGCKFVIFEDLSSVQFFDEPAQNGTVVISSTGVTPRNPPDTSRILANRSLRQTPVEY